MRKAALIALTLLTVSTLVAIPFLCVHCSLLPRRATAYYELKARREALADNSAEAQLMRMLLGDAAEDSEPEPSYPVYNVYGRRLSISALIACCLTIAVRIQTQREKVAYVPLLIAVALAVPLGFLGARLVYCAVNAGFYLKDIQEPIAMLRVWEGGLSMTGALAFGALAGVITAKLCKISVRMMLNAITPGLIAFAGMARFCERCIGAGYGPLHGSGNARLDMTLVMSFSMLVLLVIRKDFVFSAFLYGGVMILMESLRRDGHMMWGFVHAEQVFALCIALTALLIMAAKIKKAWLALGVTALMAGAVVALEFALDRSPISDTLLYGVYALIVAAYLYLGLLWHAKAFSVGSEALG